jgi:hypothetical protein
VIEEGHADTIASEWGFATEIAAMRKDQEDVLIPYFSKHKSRILRRAEQRALRGYQQDKEAI